MEDFAKIICLGNFDSHLYITNIYLRQVIIIKASNYFDPFLLKGFVAQTHRYKNTLFCNVILFRDFNGAINNLELDRLATFDRALSGLTPYLGGICSIFLLGTVAACANRRTIT